MKDWRHMHQSQLYRDIQDMRCSSINRVESEDQYGTAEVPMISSKGTHSVHLNGELICRLEAVWSGAGHHSFVAARPCIHPCTMGPFLIIQAYPITLTPSSGLFFSSVYTHFPTLQSLLLIIQAFLDARQHRSWSPVCKSRD